MQDDDPCGVSLAIACDTRMINQFQLFKPSDILASMNELHEMIVLVPSDFAYARARLTAFRTKNEWLLAFERVGFEAGCNHVQHDIQICGNRFSKPVTWSDTAMLPPRAEPSYPYFIEDDSGNIQINPYAFDVEIKGQNMHFEIEREKYQAIGIDPDGVSEHVAIRNLIRIVRYLCMQFPDHIFCSKHELLRKVDMDNFIPIFLQLHDWQNPDYRKREMPSDSICIRSLAKALAFNDSFQYDCRPELWNTHWSHWPEWPN